MPRSKKTTDFETSLNELETLVNQIEQGDLSLEDALGAFEQGVKLTRECQTILDQAEQKVQVLIEKNGELHSQPFNSGEDD
ncbi:exodeoxyribonuclease VII small subunit [Pontibacterium sp. N1Y112]|jgi:exodeoxyribonuclease VII small subunit|uniref:Exodeoxyribonuclease 7 small subunit n=1 Tax=Pontibacterium sinense TaxID=2781979 RepID=A0A8J7FA80_9GAMM|nr:exodeoxyribonuclease VII small subunit [Pontibacterium sinense]MBE9395886.1 exodeoxyribonuclease VII small subunit [Pontibacterium sinense]MCO4758338.1 exodeoxyribonuclease VII small subunit [Oceanospirillaceae bacterium]